MFNPAGTLPKTGLEQLEELHEVSKTDKFARPL